MKKILLTLILPFIVFSQDNETILNGNWDIVSLEYSTELDLSFLEAIIGFNPGSQDISGEADDAGTWSFQYPDYTYNNDFSFTTEPVTILTFEAPGVPVDISSDGTWELSGGNTITTTDQMTGLTSNYNIDVIFEQFAIISGTVPFSQEIMGYSIDLEMEIELQLQKQDDNTEINDAFELKNQKIIKTIDIEGKKTTNTASFRLYIYENGYVHKKYILE